MKTFDLTFNGAVLPEYDPEQVKRDFALLFRIEDAAVVDEIFSGETLVLRHNLDRKSAADYFRKITQLGGQATLVTSNGRDPNRDIKVGKLELVVDGPSRVIREPGPDREFNEDSPFRQTGEIDQNWPISSARIHRQQGGDHDDKPELNTLDTHSCMKVAPQSTTVVDSEMRPDSTAAIAQPEQPMPASTQATANEDTVPTDSFRTGDKQTLTRLHAVATRAKTKLQLKSVELQRRSERINQLATEKLANIEQSGQATLLRGKQSLAELRNLEEKERQVANDLRTKIQQQERLTREHSKQAIARLEALKIQTAEEEVTALTHLHQSLKETRHASAQELRRLRSLIQEARRQAKTDIGTLEQQISNLKSKTRGEIASLEQCRGETLHKLEHDLDELQQRHTSAKQQTEKNTTELKQRQQESQRQEKEELGRLQAMKLEITQQRDQEVAQVNQANARLRRRTQKALKHVHALEMEVKRRRRGALVGNADSQVKAPEPEGQV